MKSSNNRDPRGRRSKERPDLHINQLADEVGVTAGYICAILKGKKVPSITVAERLSEALGLDGVDELREELIKYIRHR